MNAFVFCLGVVALASWLSSGSRRQARRRSAGLASLANRPGDHSRLVVERLQPVLDRAAVGESPIIAMQVWAAAVVAVGAFAAAVRSLLGLLVATVVIIGPPMVLWVRRNERDRQVEADLPVALESIGRSLRSGASFVQSLGEAQRVVRPPLRRELARLDRRIQLGTSLVETLEDWPAVRPLPAVRLATAALLFSHEAGGARSGAIDGLASSLRDRESLEREVAALASQAQMSATVMAILPIGFVVASSFVDPRIADFLFGTAAGWVCLAVGIGLDCCGFVWMRRVSRTIV